MPVQRAGPELPPHLLKKRKRQAEGEPGDQVLPAAKTTPISQEVRPEEKSITRRIVGPAPPPAPLEQKPRGSPKDEEESSDEDEFGPSMPSAAQPSTNGHSADPKLDFSRSSEEQNAKPTRRDDWMTMPPKQDDLAARMDPTKIRAKGFNTGKGAKGPSQMGGEDNTMWTETPEEKRKRLANEVLGIAPPSARPHEDARSHQMRKEDEEKARLIREHNERHRNKSLYQQHQGSARKKEEDDPSKRGFDYEKDMAAGSKIGHTQRKELLNKASDFNSKFSSGKYL